jgi:hypothetical protein
VHQHVAHRHQRHRGQGAALAQPVQPDLVVQPAQLRHAQPATPQEVLQQPARHRIGRVLRTAARGQADDHTVGQRGGVDFADLQAVGAFGRAPAQRGDEAAQLAVALRGCRPAAPA